MTLRELLERERDRAAEAAAEFYFGWREDLEDEERYRFDAAKGYHLAGFNRALELLMPVVLETQDFVDDHEWAISLHEALSELRTKLGDK